MPATILVVDDEPHILNVLSAYLERDGYAVLTAGNGDDALAIARRERPDVLVLDVMLPGRSGFDVLRALRAGGQRAGVIMLTARDEVVDRVAGLEVGADDYVVKPFEPREVVARVGALVRRMERLSGAAGPPGGGAEAPSAAGAGTAAAAAPTAGIPGPERGSGGSVAERGQCRLLDLELDRDARQVRRRGAEIPLTRTEFDLLAALAEQPGRVWTREQLGARLYGEAFEAFDRTIDSHVKNLRHKLGRTAEGDDYVETVRGVGYRATRRSGSR